MLIWPSRTKSRREREGLQQKRVTDVLRPERGQDKGGGFSQSKQKRPGKRLEGGAGKNTERPTVGLREIKRKKKKKIGTSYRNIIKKRKKRDAD